MYGQAHVSWTTNSEADLAGYLVRYGRVSGGPYTTTIDYNLTATPAAPAVTMTVFETYGLLFFVVAAYDTAVPPNISANSNEQAFAVAPVLRPLTWP